MAVDASTLPQYAGKDVILHVKKDDGTVDELLGNCAAASDVGLGFKEKGKRDVVLIEPGDVEEIALAPTKPKKITQRRLDPIEDKNVRQHLVDRHGVQRSWANEADDAAAVEFHNGLDHSDLGHKHEVKKEKEEESSEASAEPSAD